MSTRRVNQVLWTLAALLGASAAVVLVVGPVLPLESEESSTIDARGPGDTARTSSLPQLAVLESIAEKRFRRELAPVSVEPMDSTRLARSTVESDGSVPFTLVGTIGNSLAMLQNSAGEVEVRAVGEDLAGVEVLEIQPARVNVRFNGRIITLEKAPFLSGSEGR